MRVVNILTGIKQRTNDILGQQVVGGDTGDLTPWSIQAAMISNLSRLISALVGNSDYGRILKGLQLSINGASVHVSAGFGITMGGGIITLTNDIDYPFTDTDAIWYWYFRHNIIQAPDGAPGYKETSVINQSGNIPIVYDEQGMAQQTAITVNDVITKSSSKDSNERLVYLGKITWVSGTPTVEQSPYQGFST